MRRGEWFKSAALCAVMVTLGVAPNALAQSASDQPGDSTSTARVTTGQAVNGVIDTAGDRDWYRLSVQPGQMYRITLDSSGEPAIGDPMLALYNSAGQEIARNDDAGSLNSALTYTASQPEELFVEASAYSSAATGGYTLNVNARDIPPDNAGNDSGSATAIGSAATVNGALEYPGDRDWFRLSVQPNRIHRIALNSAAGDGALRDPYLIIYDADGNELSRNDDFESLNSRLDYVAQERGVIYVEARGLSEDDEGAYTLITETLPLPRDEAGATTSTRGRLRVGESLTGGLDYATDTDWYRIALVGGESYRFALDSLDGDDALSDPVLALRNAQGDEVATDDDSGANLNSYLEFTAPATGNYYLEARSFAADATGRYTLRAAEGDIPASVETDASISADGDYREGTLAPAGDTDWYRIELSEGQSVRVGLDSGHTGGVGDPYLVMYGPNGEQVGSDDDGGTGLNSWLEYTAVTGGAHFIEARGFGEEAEGTYALSVTAGEIPNNYDGAEYLLPGGEPRDSVIGENGDVDWFAVELIEGRPYRFNLEGSGDGALADPYLRLIDAQGNEVAADDDGGSGVNSYLTFVSTTGGPYFAAVSSYGDTGTGRYSLRVTDTDVPGHVGTDEFLDAENGDDRVSRIDMSGDLDSYRTDFSAGLRYTISVTGEGDTPLTDPFLTVLNSSGETITTDDDSGNGLDAQLSFTAPATDSYFVQASGLGGSTGTYRVSITRQ